MKHEWKNYGDVSPWHGQLWLRVGGEDWAECVEIIGPGDFECLADNQIMIEFGSVFISPQWADWQSALECVGFEFNGPPEFMTLAMSFHAYRGQEYDTYQPRQIVQFGAKPEIESMPSWVDPLKADIVLHGNTKPENYIAGILI